MKIYQKLAITLSLGLSLMGCGGAGTEENLDLLPVAVDDTATVYATQKKLTVISVLKNDKPKGKLDISSVEIIRPPEFGRVNIRTSGEVEYTPSSFPPKADNFAYTVKDNKGNFSNPATVTINIIQEPFKITVKTDNTGVSNNNEFTIPIVGGSYDIDCGNSGAINGTAISGEYTCQYPSSGTYTIAITGDIPQIIFLTDGASIGKDNLKLISINQWGTSQWGSMQYAFMDCSNMTVTATDAPNLSAVTNMSYMFSGATLFNGDISNWDVSNITRMRSMFNNASAFNQNIGAWDVSSVDDMKGMFSNATSFNQDISSWDISSVSGMTDMFTGASAFTTSNYDKLLVSWSDLADTKGVLSGVILSTLGVKLSCYSGQPGPNLPPLVAKNNLQTNHGWTIKDNGCLARP